MYICTSVYSLPVVTAAIGHRTRGISGDLVQNSTNADKTLRRPLSDTHASWVASARLTPNVDAQDLSGCTSVMLANETSASPSVPNSCLRHLCCCCCCCCRRCRCCCCLMHVGGLSRDTRTRTAVRVTKKRGVLGDV